MKAMVFVLLFGLLVSCANAMSCTYDLTPNLWSDLRMSCATSSTNSPRCYAFSQVTGESIVVGDYPRGTFDYNMEKYYVPSVAGGFIVTVPLGGEYLVRTNYTINVTCFNSTVTDSSTYTILTTLARPPDFIGAIVEWGVSYGRYIALGAIILFVVVGAFWVIFIRK